MTIIVFALAALLSLLLWTVSHLSSRVSEAGGKW